MHYPLHSRQSHAIGVAAECSRRENRQSPILSLFVSQLREPQCDTEIQHFKPVPAGRDVEGLMTIRTCEIDPVVA